MPVVSKLELSADDAPRGIDESSSIFSTIERNVPVNIPSNEDGKSFKQKKTMKTQIKSLKKTFVRKVKWFHSRKKPVAETFATNMATELHSPMEQLAVLNPHHIHGSAIPQDASPPVSALSPYEDNVLAPDSPLDAEMPAPLWYAAHVPTLQDYVADGAYGPGSPETDQDSAAELSANIPRTILSMYQQQSMSASSELNDFDTSAMVLASFHIGATESDIESASSYSTDDSSSDDSSDAGSEAASGLSKTSTESARNDSDLSTLGDDSSSDGSFNIDSDYDEALVSQEQRESFEFGDVSNDIAFHDFASLSDGLPANESGPMVFAAIINSVPEIEGPLQAMQAMQARPRAHVTFEDNVQATQSNAALPQDIVVQDAGMRPRSFASNGEAYCSPFEDSDDGIGHGDEASPFSLTSPVLPLFCRDDGSRSSSSPSDIFASAGSLLPEYAHMPEHASIGTANALQPNVEGLASANFGDLIAEIDGIIQKAATPASARIHEDFPSSKRESWICNFLNFDRRRNSLLATGDYESENSDEEEFLADSDTNETYEHNEGAEKLIEKCNENLSLGRRWITTKLLLERIEKDTGFSETTENTSTSASDSYERCPFGAVMVDKTEKTSTEQQSSRFSRKLFEHSTRIMNFDTNSESLSDDSESREISRTETEELKEIVYDYRILFRHLIRTMVLPCGDKLRRLIQNIFYVRIIENEVIAEAARINSEIFATRLNFEEFPAKFLPYLQARLERCSPAFKCLEKLSKKCHDEMVSLETRFNSNIQEFISEIKEIAANRVRALDLYDHLVKVYQGRDDFDEDYIHEWTRVAEYRRITLWYQNTNTARFENLLAKNISTLRRTGETISDILITTHGNIQNARKVLSMTEQGSLTS